MRKCYTISSNLSKYCCFCVFMGGGAPPALICSNLRPPVEGWSVFPLVSGLSLYFWSKVGYNRREFISVWLWLAVTGYMLGRLRMRTPSESGGEVGPGGGDLARQGLFSCPSRDYLKDHEETGHADNLNIQCEASRRTFPQNVLQRSGSCLIIRCRRPCVKAR